MAKRPRDQRTRAYMWVLLVVLVGLLPILFHVVYALDRGKPLRLTAILQRGDLLLLSTAVAGGCLYDLFNKPVANDRKNLLASMLFVMAAMAAMWFTDLAEASTETVSTVTRQAPFSVPGTPGTEQPPSVLPGPSNSGRIAVGTIVFLGLTAAVGLRVELLTSGEEG